MTAPPILEAHGVGREYAGGARALSDVSIALSPGELVAVAGPSGSGKTTLLAILGGLDRPSEGAVTLDGQDLYALAPGALARFRSERIAFVFQTHNLLPNLSALDNVALAVETVRGNDEAIDKSRAALASLGLDRLEHRIARRLSLGEQQRVAVARALAVGPRALIADEPTASLDGASGERVLDALEAARAAGCAILLASHDERCLRRAGRTVRLADGRRVD